jgi:hypothetical protein
MDIICPVCGEKFEMDGLHDPFDTSLSFKQALHQFQKTGCRTVFGNTGCFPGANGDEGSAAAAAARALFDLLGDDVDDVAAMLEDFGF